MDGGAWRAAVHGVAKSWTRLKQLSIQVTGPSDAQYPSSDAQTDGSGADTSWRAEPATCQQLWRLLVDKDEAGVLRGICELLQRERGPPGSACTVLGRREHRAALSLWYCFLAK